MILESTITCPQCGLAKREIMPEEFCLIRYECRGCGTLLRPRQGDCCVYCSYGSAPCPPRQVERSKPDSGCCG